MFGKNQTLHSNISTSSQPWSMVVGVSWFVAALLPQDPYGLSSLMKPWILDCTSKFYRSSVREQKLNRRWVMQKDNDPQHTRKSTTEWLKQKRFCLMEWPSQSPNFNSMEMMWQNLKRAVHARKQTNISELKKFGEEWAKMPPSRCAGLIKRYRKRLMEVIAAEKGCHQLLNVKVHRLFQKRN